MNEATIIDVTPKKAPWYHFPIKMAIILLVAIIGLNVFDWSSDWVIDRRPVDATAYRLMADWTNNPHRRSGADYSSLLPAIRKVMKDEVVYYGEWRPILKAKQDIEREHDRQQMIRALRSNKISG